MSTVVARTTASCSSANTPRHIASTTKVPKAKACLVPIFLSKDHCTNFLSKRQSTCFSLSPFAFAHATFHFFWQGRRPANPPPAEEAQDRGQSQDPRARQQIEENRVPKFGTDERGKASQDGTKPSGRFTSAQILGSPRFDQQNLRRPLSTTSTSLRRGPACAAQTFNPLA